MLKDLIKKNRSYRCYNRDRKIPHEEVLDMIDHARLSASSINLQPLKFYIADGKDAEIIEKETKLAGLLPELHLPIPGTEPPLYIVICHDERISKVKDFSIDVGIAAQSITLAAAEKGLGACMLGSYNKNTIDGILAFPEYLKTKLIIAIGEPAEEPVLEDMEAGGKTAYYRDEKGVHHVPKRKLEDLIVEK